jgi:hypothetical protein
MVGLPLSSQLRLSERLSSNGPASHTSAQRGSASSRRSVIRAMAEEVKTDGLPADKGAALTKEKPVEASGAPIQRVNSIPVALRADGAGAGASSSWAACAACCAAAAAAPPRCQPAAPWPDMQTTCKSGTCAGS